GGPVPISPMSRNAPTMILDRVTYPHGNAVRSPVAGNPASTAAMAERAQRPCRDAGALYWDFCSNQSRPATVRLLPIRGALWLQLPVSRRRGPKGGACRHVGWF